MKKSKTNNKSIMPSMEEIDSDLNKILNMLEEIDTMSLSINTDISKLSENINNQLGIISQKYNPLLDHIEEEEKKNPLDGIIKGDTNETKK